MYKNLDTKLAYRVFTGGPLVCISTKNKQGTDNIMTAAWSCPYDTDMLLLVLDLGHTTTANLKDGSKLVVALPSKDQKDIALKLGSVHGSESGDKFEHFKLPFEKSLKLGFKTLKDANAYFECELTDPELLKDKGICLCKVLNVYVKEELFDDESQSFVPGCLNTLHHVSGGSFSTSGEIV